ncbi:MAG: tyrosine-type recombinase/integrase [Planctomycetaceae bacterium]|nr:tyrosine-type recombinase/integrase [Planctomycetaceae bacterium]
MDAIKVTLHKRGDRKNWDCRWVDPKTGRVRWKSTGTATKRTAEKTAAALEASLNHGAFIPGRRMPWTEAIQLFREDPTVDLSRVYVRRDFERSINAINDTKRPGTLQEIDTDFIAALIPELQKRPGTNGNLVSDVTVAGYLRVLKRVLTWAVKKGSLPEVPDFPPFRAEAAAKGKALTETEFQRMLAAAPETYPMAGRKYQQVLWALWWSGLRIGELRELRWADDMKHISVDTSQGYPRFWIPKNADKAKKKRARSAPMAPEFWEFLSQNFAPEDQEGGGRVFPSLCNKEDLSRNVSQIGRTAGIQVSDRGKFASAHDLRRSFCVRWAKRVPPKQLKDLARHANIETTLTYYADQDEFETSALIWQKSPVSVAKYGFAEALKLSKQVTNGQSLIGG